VKRTPRKQRFPSRPWELKYARAFKPKLKARAEKIVKALYDSGAIERFQTYLMAAYPGWGTRPREQRKDATHDTDADMRAFDRIAGSANKYGWDVDKLTEELTTQLFAKSSQHAFAKLGVKASWNVDSPATKKAIRQRQNLIKDVGDRQFGSIKSMIRQQVYDLGGNPVDTKFLAQLQTTAGKATQYEAERIARTEVAAVQSTASYTVYSENGVERKQWLTAGDDAVRDGHMELEGETVGIDETFSNGLMYPGDENGDAGDVINCRCCIVPIVSSTLDPDEAVTE